MLTKKTFITILGWAISVAILWSIFAHMDFAALGDGLKRANWLWLVLAAVINIVVIGIKVVRWQFIVTPVTRIKSGLLSHYFVNLKASVIGMAANNVLPARGGDWLKVYLLGKWTELSKTTLASVVVVDKVFEGITLLILFVLFSTPAFNLSHGLTFPNWVEKGSITISIIIVALLIICTLLLVYHKRVESNDNHGRIEKFIKKLGIGMSILSQKKLMTGSIFISLLSALLQIATIWSCQEAFGVHLNIFVASLIFIAVNLAITIPSAPSGIGPFEAAAVLTYAWIGIKTETAFNIALMYHAVQFIPITLLGLFFYLKKSTPRLTTTEY